MRRIDPFLLVILLTATMASLLPVRGWGVGLLSGVCTVAIGVLFFMYGARLPTQEAWKALGHWRLHSIILAFTYLVFPVAGVLVGALAEVAGVAPDVATGLVYLTLVPSTVQASITFTSLARGNVAGAVVSASTSNLLGVALTPLLVALVLGREGAARLSWGTVIELACQILLPFILGQLARRWLADAMIRHHAPLKRVDQAVIVLMVYSAFSAAARSGAFAQVTWRDLLVTAGVCAVLLAGMFWLTWWAAGRLGFSREDQIAIQFCGTKKSLATGLPMATLLFSASSVGLVVVPLMVFHQAQLMVSSALASRYARRE